MSDETNSVEARMLKVMAEAGVIGKDRKAPGLNYAFRGIDDILPILQPLFIKHGVLPVPEVIERERETVQTSNGKPMFSVRLLVRFTFRAPGAVPVVAVTLGEAMDSGDKASNKAMTAAFKAALTMSFSIPTHESDRDTEENSPELATTKARVTFTKPEKVDPLSIEALALVSAAAQAKTVEALEALRPRYEALKGTSEFARVGTALAKRKQEVQAKS